MWSKTVAYLEIWQGGGHITGVWGPEVLQLGPEAELLWGSGVNLVWNLEGRGSGSTKFRFFQANFREISIFFRQFHKKIRFFQAIFKKFWFFQANFWKISIFSGKFVTNFGFSRQIFEKFRFFQANFKKFPFSQGNFWKIWFFQAILKKIDFPGKNCSFTATFGQLFYFSSKVTTFEHTSCTW